ncbi:hypothetical protein [Dactylosporangium sp. NPDC051484]|uniref:hypothetical protein n=1 Tax=Dactylosporangium sp. NPDC051484 TaxID=3154942 RepID=UPI00345017ED
MTRRTILALVLLFLAALCGVGVAAAASADDGSVTITITVPEGASPSPSPSPGGPSGDLPRTGVAVAVMLGGAVALIVVGAGLIALGRRSGKSNHPLAP